MKLNKLIKTMQFLNNFKEEYSFLKIGENMYWDSSLFDKDEYSITIYTGVLVLDGEMLSTFLSFFKNIKLLWFIGVLSDELTIHVQ